MSLRIRAAQNEGLRLPEQIQEKWKPLFRLDADGVSPPFLRQTKERSR
jgi:hypothetical protein